MSKTSLVIGILLSVVVHAAVFFPHRREADRRTAQDTIDRKPISITLPEPKPVEDPPTSPQPDKPVEGTPRLVAETPPAPVERELSRVAEATSAMDDASGLGDLATDADEETLPAMRIVWSSPEELRLVSQALGMRIIAVNAGSEILGEVALQGDVRLVDFQGDLASYSNRVRIIPRHFFGHSLAAVRTNPVSSFWILVPVSLDAHLMDVLRKAIVRRGARLADVRSVNARFMRSDTTGYELVVTEVRVVEGSTNRG